MRVKKVHSCAVAMIMSSRLSLFGELATASAVIRAAGKVGPSVAEDRNVGARLAPSRSERAVAVVDGDASSVDEEVLRCCDSAVARGESAVVQAGSGAGGTHPHCLDLGREIAAYGVERTTHKYSLALLPAWAFNGFKWAINPNPNPNQWSVQKEGGDG